MSLIRTLKECIAQLIVSLYNAQLNFPQPKPLPAACYGSVPMICDENVTTNSLPSFYYKLEPRIKLPLKVKAEAGVSKPWKVMNATQHKLVNLLKTFFLHISFC